MPTTHFARSVFKGGGQGSAAHRVHYITRTLTPDRAAVQVRYQGIVEGTDQAREDLVCWQARNLPDWAGADAERTAANATIFFRAAEQYTSTSQIAYEEWKFSIPRELTRTQQLDAARDFLVSTFGTTHPYVWAMHDPVAADGGRQPHVHVLWSARTLDGTPRSPEHFFRQSSTAHPERGGAPRARELGHFGSVKAARVHYTDIMNMHLEQAGIEARLHPDRLEARGILRKPEPRLLPADSDAYKRGEITPLMQEVLDHRKRYTQARQREQRLALAYWEARARELGLARDMDESRKVARVREAREQRAREVPPRGREEAPVAPRQRLSRSREGLVADGERTMRLIVPLVGNRSSQIYHAPGDPNYGAVSPRQQVLFWTIAEAEDAGYRAAANQHWGRGKEQRREGGEARSRDRTSRSRGLASLDVEQALEGDGPHGQDERSPHGLRMRLYEEAR